MSDHSAERRASKALQELGLTEYEAKCFAGLSRIPSGTAKEISELTVIPRSRVYDVTDALHDRGLIEIREGSPREFRAVSPDLAATKLEREFQDHLDAASEALAGLSPRHGRRETGGVWTIEGRYNVIERGQQLSAEAEDELFGLFTEDAVFEENCFRQAHNAIDRGVTVFLGSPDEGLRDELRDEFPEAIVWKPNLEWQTLSVAEGQVSRLVMADRNRIMIGSLRGEAAPGELDENAIWGWGETNGVLLVMRQIIGSHLDEVEDTGNMGGIPL